LKVESKKKAKNYAEFTGIVEKEGESRSLHSATAKGAVAPVGMTRLDEAPEGGAKEIVGPLRSE
jgi:hypothetical protein